MKIILLACAFFLGGGSWATSPSVPAGTFAGVPELRLFQAFLEKSEEQSMMVSPFSLYEVLRCLLPGAVGETGKQIRAVLPGDGSIRKDWTFLSKDFSRSLRCYCASRLVVDRSVNLKPGYVKAVGRDRVAKAPFRENKAEAVRQVNAWVSQCTENRINGFLRPESVNDSTVIVLVNSLYMRAFWSSEFKRESTGVRPFFREDGSSCNVFMMRQQVFTEGDRWPREGGKYYEKNGMRGASLFFAGGKKAPVFMAVLPPAGKKLKRFVAEMTVEEWKDILSVLSARDSGEPSAQADEKRWEGGSRYHLRLPRFSLSFPTVSLEGALMALGVKDAFSDRADFSLLGSVPLNPLKVSGVFQKSMIRVGEEGLEAAASSGSEMEPFAGPPPFRPGPEIEFNRPFLWLVYSPEDAAVLLLGTYAGPPLR